MNRLDRITSILIQLQSKRLITAREIAERFEVSIRTVYRDIQTLRLAGVPIGEEEGRGYFIVDGYRLPPVMFSPDEANALVAIQKMINYHSEDSLKKNYEAALLKIKAVLRSSEKDKLEYLNSRIGYHEPWAPQSSNLSTIQLAITDHIKIEIEYESKKEEFTKRLINPYALYFNGAVWTTIGYCNLRKGIREFRLDRIEKLNITKETFDPNPDFKIEKYLEERSKRLF